MTESSPSQQTLCGVCHSNVSKYTCPRCNAQHCSLQCYRQHSEQCVEEFYRDSTTEELKSITVTEVEKENMLAILKKLHEQHLEEQVVNSDADSAEDEDALSKQTLEQLQRKIEAGLEFSEADLSLKDLQTFHTDIAAGAVKRVVKIWDPWWHASEVSQLELSKEGIRLVMPAHDHGGSEVQETAAILPAPPSQPLLPLSALTKSPPSPFLQYHLLDILYAYCYVMRLYNGDYLTDPAEATQLLFELSAVLSSANGRSSSNRTECEGGPISANVLLDCARRVCSPSVGNQLQRPFANAVVMDVAAILKAGRSAVLIALMDAMRMIETAKHDIECVVNKGGKSLQRMLTAAERKLMFFLSWANEQPSQCYNLLEFAARAQFENLKSAMLSNDTESLFLVNEHAAVGREQQQSERQHKQNAVQEL